MYTICSSNRISRILVISYFGCGTPLSITSSHFSEHIFFSLSFLPLSQNDQEPKNEIQVEQKIIFFFWSNFYFDMMSYFPLLDHDRKCDLSNGFHPSLDLSVLWEEIGDCAFCIVAWIYMGHCNKKWDVILNGKL